MILFCTIKLGYDNYQAATVNLAFVGTSTLTPVLVGWFAESCLGRTKVLYLCALLHFFGTAMLPVVAFPFEDFYIDTHHIMHTLAKRDQQIFFYIGLLAASLGIGGIRAILCPLSAYSLQDYDQHELLSFFNWFYWLVNLNSAIVFVGISYIQQSVAKNLGFLIPFTSVLLALIAIHMVRSNLTFRPKKVAGHLCAAVSAMVAGLSELNRKGYPSMEQALSGKVLHISSMACFQLAPQYILLGVAEALVTPACKNDCILHCYFVNILFIFSPLYVMYVWIYVSGNCFPNSLSDGCLERFFFLLASLMAINAVIFWKISNR
ncbi:S15A5 protein, partial [Amia calva]|nr:S15A5 protein [Amia calva]